MAVEEEVRARELQVMKRRATGLLLVVSLAFVAIVAAGDDGGWWGYAQAAAEGSMVGGLADWFAVTALFRHPLGLPIPHTAIIRERKDQFGATLGGFVQDNFLSADNVAERIHTARVTERAVAWLVQRQHAETVARYVSEALVGLADAVPDEDVRTLVDDDLARLVERLPVADLAARGLEVVTADGRHQQLLDSILRSVSGYLDDNRDDLRARFADESPWWLPGAAQDRIFERLVDGVTAWLTAIVADPTHEMRSTFDQRVGEFIHRLRTDPALVARAEELKHDVAEHPELRVWVGGLWSDLKGALATQADDPSSRLRQRVADAVVAGAERLAADANLQAKVTAALERAVRYAADNYGDEIGELIAATIARWDGEETSRKLELLLGRDLQFIRINGTVVGALAGLVIHTVADLAG